MSLKDFMKQLDIETQKEVIITALKNDFCRVYFFDGKYHVTTDMLLNLENYPDFNYCRCIESHNFLYW